MMRRVPQDNVDKCSSTRAETIRSPDTRPRGWRDAIDERQRACSLQLELRHQVLDAAQVKLACRHIGRLVKSWEFGHVAAADPKQPVGKDSFRVEKVTDHLLDRPLSFSVAEHRA